MRDVVGVQLNLMIGDEMHALPQFDGYVPRVGETVFACGKVYKVSAVVYEFLGATDQQPYLRQRHVNVELIDG